MYCYRSLNILFYLKYYALTMKLGMFYYITYQLIIRFDLLSDRFEQPL